VLLLDLYELSPGQRYPKNSFIGNEIEGKYVLQAFKSRMGLMVNMPTKIDKAVVILIVLKILFDFVEQTQN
jgi:hypothetical protein